MRNHIKFLSWRANHDVPNCQVMSGSMIMHWDLPRVLPVGPDVPTPLPCSCICPQRAAHEHWGGSYRSCQMLDADFKLAFGFVLWQGFVTPPASQVPALLTAAFPAPGDVGSVSATEPSQDWQLGVGSPPWRRDGVQAGGIWILCCWLASIVQLWWLGVFFSSSTNALLIMKAGGKGLSAMLFLLGQMMPLVHLSWIIDKKVTGAWLWLHHTWSSLGAAHLTLLPFLLPLCSAGALPWAPLCSSFFFVMLRIAGQELLLCKGWGGWWGLRGNDCALVGIGNCEIPGYVLYSWFALK